MAMAGGKRPSSILKQRKLCSSTLTEKAMARLQEQGADNEPPNE